MNTKRLLATAAMTAGMAIGLAATANAQPIDTIGDEAGFNECIKEHPDAEGFAVCCVFYGGILEEGPNYQSCIIGDVTAPEEAATPKGSNVVRPGLIDDVQTLEPAASNPRAPRPDVIGAYQTLTPAP
jgi:hypothetical protein